MYYDMDKDELREEYDRLHNEKDSNKIELWKAESKVDELTSEVDDLSREIREVGEAIDRK